MFIAFTLACDQDSRSIARRWRLVYGADHMHHDCEIMFEDLFAMSGLSLERLKSFADIVAAGGISAAAGDDSNRQSQFSRQLKELERYFGVELIKRGRGPMKLTPAGEQLHRVISTGPTRICAVRSQRVGVWQATERFCRTDRTRASGVVAGEQFCSPGA